jgi:hypothetical protein
MHLTRFALAIAMLSGFGAASVAAAQTKPAPRPAPRVILLDPNYNRSPPVPHQRNYVGPGPTVVAPMERIPSIAPLAQPPIR